MESRVGMEVFWGKVVLGYMLVRGNFRRLSRWFDYLRFDVVFSDRIVYCWERGRVGIR